MYVDLALLISLAGLVCTALGVLINIRKHMLDQEVKREQEHRRAEDQRVEDAKQAARTEMDLRSIKSTVKDSAADTKELVQTVQSIQVRLARMDERLDGLEKRVNQNERHVTALESLMRSEADNDLREMQQQQQRGKQ